jgi:putative ubiquitin-RnfH superfamily antitoxin RatB of RatAB toxin-antitoxin module
VNGAMMRVVIAIAHASRQIEQRTIELPDGACLKDALDACALEPSAAAMSAGVWGRMRPLDWRLEDGDRVELCRTLEVDPMEARRRRHAHQQRWKAAKASAEVSRRAKGS